MKKSLKISLILLAGLIIRLILYQKGTLTVDFNTFVAWSDILVERGFRTFYQGWSDYLPGYLYCLWALGKIKSVVALDPVLFYKLPAILADLVTGWLIYKVIKKEKQALIAAAIYVFNPAILANSTLWGQVDSLTALFSLLSLYLVEVSTAGSAVALAIGTAIKPQTAFVGPVILFLMIKNKWDFKKIFIYLIVGLSVFVGLFLPFVGEGNLLAFIVERLSATASQYPYTSVNAFNFWGVLGLWQRDTLVTTMVGCVLAVGAIGYALRHRRQKYFLATVSFLATFIFLTRLHERHMLPVFAPLTISSVTNPALWIPYFGLSVTYLANLAYAHAWVSQEFKSIFSTQAVQVISLANVILLGWVVFAKRFKLPKLGIQQEVKLPAVKLPKKTGRLILVGILGFSLVSRIIFLWQPEREYFDEVYHAFTARRILHRDPKAWEWWNTPPEGFAYEWTHPPFAKLAMVAGMTVFGENAFGWRVPAAIFGMVAVLLVYLLAKEIFADKPLALLAMAIFSLDGLPLVMSRIGMNDIYFLAFGLASIYFFWREKYFGSAVTFGLAAASKWSALYVLPVLAAIFLVRKRQLFNWRYLWFLVLPPAIYLASYFPMFTTGHGLDTFWGMQKQMWWYHTGLVATHAYQSPAWSWPLMLRPVYLFVHEAAGMIGKIYAMGNPIVFWFGLVSVILTFYQAVVEKSGKLVLVVASYFAFFVPWIASPRIMFLYHYLPSLPFLSVATAYILRRHRKFIPWFFGLTLVVFVYFYPRWTGIEIPVRLDETYYWLGSWQ